jgi:hypothetical protein
MTVMSSISGMRALRCLIRRLTHRIPWRCPAGPAMTPEEMRAHLSDFHGIRSGAKWIHSPGHWHVYKHESPSGWTRRHTHRGGVM